LREALLDAGTMRLRPVLSTVGATVFGLVPLAKHGGPLCEPLWSREGIQTVAAAATTLSNFRTLVSHSRREIESELEGRSRLAWG